MFSNTPVITVVVNASGKNLLHTCEKSVRLLLGQAQRLFKGTKKKKNLLKIQVHIFDLKEVEKGIKV